MSQNNLEPAYVICRNKVEDGEGVYNLPGMRYDIHEILEDQYRIAVEPGLSDADEIDIAKDDPDFLIVYEGEDI